MGRLSIPSLNEAFVLRFTEVSRAELGLDHLVGPRRVDRVAAVSRRSTLERAELGDLRGDAHTLSARLQFFLLKLHGPARVSALPRKERWRVLDPGAGVGATSLGVARFAALSGKAGALDVTAVDVDAEALPALGVATRAQRLDRQRTEENAELELAERGCIIRVSHAEPVSPGGLIRIGKAVEVQVVQRRERESDPPE